MGVLIDPSSYKPQFGSRSWARALDDGDAEFHVCHWYSTIPSFGFRNRVVDEHICNFISDGGMRACIDGHEYQLHPGSIIWVAPGVPHDFATLNHGRGFTMINTRFSLRRQGRDQGFPERVLVGHDRWDLRPLFDLLLDGLSRNDAGERAKRIWYLLYTDLTTPEIAEIGALNRRRQQLIIAEVHRHVQSTPTPGDLARLLGLTPDYFRRVFHRTFGLSPRSWIARERIRIAAQQLLDDPNATVGDVASACGFSDVSLFSRRFKKIMGTGPRAWRQR